MGRLVWCAPACLALLACCGCGGARKPDAAPAGVRLEVFVFSPAHDSDTIGYVRRLRDLSGGKADPDSVARELTRGIGVPAILHSTSWRWEKDGTIVLTYLAYVEKADFAGPEPVRLGWDEFAPPRPTDPQRPRPERILERDVLAHGVRHLSFLVRYARDGRLASALSPRSLAFFGTMCGQLAGRLETAREFEECAAVVSR